MTIPRKVGHVWDRNRWTITYIAVVVTLLLVLSVHELISGRVV